MKTFYIFLISILTLSISSADLRVAVVAEPEYLRLKVEASLFNSPYCKIIE